MSDGFNQGPRGWGIKLEKLITPKSWRRYRACLEATLGGIGRRKAASAQQDLGHVPFLQSKGEVLWGSLAKARLVNTNQKALGFGELSRGLL